MKRIGRRSVGRQVVLGILVGTGLRAELRLADAKLAALEPRAGNFDTVGYAATFEE